MPVDKLLYASAEFIRAEIASGLTFAQVASADTDGESRKRNLDKAHSAYAVAIRCLPTVTLSADDRAAMQESLDHLVAAIAAIPK